MNDITLIPASSQLVDGAPRAAGAARYSVAHALDAFKARMMPSSWITIGYALTRAASDLGFYDYDLKDVPWDKVDYPVLQRLIGVWKPVMAGATLKLHVYAVRGLLRSCFTHGLISQHAYTLLGEVKAGGDTNEVGRGKYVEDLNRHRLIESCNADDRRTLAARDKAIIALLFGAGIRRAEAVNLEIGNLNLAHGSFRVTVKGGRFVEKYLAGWAIKYLQEWLDVLAEQGQATGRVLRRVSNGGRALADMKPGGLYKALAERSLVAGVPIIKPHDARRTVATNLIRAKGISFAKIALGHKSITTTQRYDMTDSDEIRAHFISQTS